MTTDDRDDLQSGARPNRGTFTGVVRRRQTRMNVRVAERTARFFITVGGLGTIVAISLIFFFLLNVVFPLFESADIEEVGKSDLHDNEAVALGIDRYEVLAWMSDGAGHVRTFRPDDGTSVAELSTEREDGGVPISQSFSPMLDRAVLGYADGGVVLVEISFEEEYPTDEEAPDAAHLAVGEVATTGDAVVQRTPIGQLRSTRLVWDAAEASFPSGDSPIVLADSTKVGDSPSFASLSEDGKLALTRIRVRKSMFGDETRTAKVYELPYESPEGLGLPAHLFLNGRGSDVVVLWEDGTCRRYTFADGVGSLAEEIDMLPEDGVRVTAASHVLGQETIAVADSTGRLSSWFLARPGSDDAPLQLVNAGESSGLEGTHFTSLVPSMRSRLLVAGADDGRVALYHVTSMSIVGSASSGLDAPIQELAYSPEERTVLAVSGPAVARLAIDPKFPEATFASLFTKVWYEGYPGPEHVWQSTGGTDEFEPKFGMVPLIFGTLKATFYSMIFGAPLALLAAIFTSEFLSGRVRARVKTVMELMASLPSVVLGFLGGLVIAPFVQGHLAAVLATLFAIPFMFLLGAHLWQLLPRRVALPWNHGWQRFGAIATMVPIAVVLGATIGPAAERAFFGGDAESWLGGGDGGTFGGWVFMLLPLSLLLVGWVVQRYVDPLIRNRFPRAEHGTLARVHLVKFVAAAAGSILLAVLVGGGLSGVGFDPRGGVVDSYAQRNALVVGFVMGFAIIPIIYTLAEDALSSVPQHLRLASLGAGATQWQTAVRVIVPTAMSGLFSAVMIGLGRAVGETMIVLMATGNTPIMEFNMFNGFRTLSANIAFEMPEVVKNSTHYRVLFLAGLVLFGMTFVLNTLAEVVRQRYRKRAYQL
ncbi:MAG: ABC transporter permease subunit [Planctomycetota bacterium]